MITSTRGVVKFDIWKLKGSNFYVKKIPNVMRKIQQYPQTSQRDLAQQLGFSLGKLNYCLKALQQKGLIKIKNFKKNPNKFNYIYVLTPRGISIKTKLTINFMKRKIKEYDELKKELKEKK